MLLRLEWTVVRRLDGLLQGDYRTLFRGFGLDLAELREYQLGDDVRTIDWNVTARMATPYVRQYNEDREVTAWFLLDLSPSMDFGSESTRKRTLLVELVTVLARLLTRHGNRVGAVFFGDGVDALVPAGGGRRHLLLLLHSLLARPELPRSRPTDLTSLLETALRLVERRSLLFLVSDFFSLPGWDRPLSLLAERHEVLAVRLRDPFEVELPDLGIIQMRDAETGEGVLVDTHDRSFRRRFTATVERRDGELYAALRRARVELLELSTADALLDSLLRFAELRRRRVAGSRADVSRDRQGGRR